MEKVLWATIVILAFAGAFFLINNSYLAWKNSPIATNIITHPVDKLDFPTVTVCPPEGSNTALYPDLVKADNNSLSDDDRKQLMASIKDIVKTSTLDFAENVLAATNPANLERLYKGYQSFPSQYKDGFEIKVGDIKGSVKSPRFGESYQENDFKADKSIHIILDLQPAIQNAGTGTLVVELEVDTRQEEGWEETVEYSEGSQFKVFTAEDKSWTEAQAQCQAAGGQLASMKTEEEQDEFDMLDIRKSKMRGGEIVKISTYAWIGARQEAEGKDWLWPDGTKVKVDQKVEAAMPWDKHPLCISVSTSMAWQARSCNSRILPFVCRYEPKAVTGMKNMTLKYQLEYKLGEDNKVVLTSKGESSFHVWYSYKAVSQRLLDSWKNKRMTGFSLSWRVDAFLSTLTVRNPNVEVLTAGYGDNPHVQEKSSIRDEFSFRVNLELSRNLTRQIGNGSLVIELETNFDEEMAPTEWIEYFEGQKYFLGGINSDWNKANDMCQFDGVGLASIKTKGEWLEMKNLVPEAEKSRIVVDIGGDAVDGVGTSACAWLGGKEDDDEVWRWTDGTEMKNIVWDDVNGDPPYCACMKNGRVLQHQCSMSGYSQSVCQRKTRRLIKRENKSFQYTQQQVDNLTLFQLWYQRAERSPDEIQHSRKGGFRFAWYIEEIFRNSATASKMNSSMVLDPVTSSPSKLTDRRLNMLVEQAAIARMEGLSNGDIIRKAFSEKERIDTGKCLRGHSYYSSKDFGTVQLGLDASSNVGNVALSDIENGITAYAIFLFCPKEASKMGQFMEQLVSNASPRSLLLAVVNSLQSDNLNRNDRALLNMFYKDLDRIMDLKFGRILLALSTHSQLETMLAKDLPYATQYAEEIHHCISEYNCTGITSLISTIGDYCKKYDSL